MADDILIKSTARGTAGYDIYPDSLKKEKTKSKSILIAPGINQITADDYELLKKDDGFKARVKKGVYEELSDKEIKTEATVKELKQSHKEEISQLKDKQKEEINALKTEQKKALEDAKKEHDSNLAGLKSDLKKAEDQVAKLQKQNKELAAAAK